MHLRELFDKVDRNGNGRLSELELSNALLNDDYSKFRPSTVRLILKLFDKENKNYIDFKEFCRLWNYIGYWRKVFTKFDKEGSQTISFSEYQNALEKIGYRLSTDTILFIFQKFSDGSLQLKFDMFVESLIWLLKITDSFKKYDYQGNGIAVIQFKDYVEEILSFN
ncbi:hypothetical protein PACTADRAFT_37020 [Pachysolen tannophilus NRRL Y-2460]|uniref:EF-hand domain-containing protein n=1 Tax=Pachysolen tannophilus NRRL Y-2460 TaxID=669874 RepID=A0A1E4U3A5_PACTA|nr:hypothetical protein PACTADRAFT_37020 [Pachysolen tannophilus NRRL Y-2460]